MKVSIAIGGAASGSRRDFQDQIEFVVEAEKLGVHAVWTAEAWGQDAIAPLAYLAARTERIKLGTGIMQISARTPSMTAMTALTMAAISNDRFILGLGVSGPQVVEGLQGRPFRQPLTRRADDWTMKAEGSMVSKASPLRSRTKAKLWSAGGRSEAFLTEPPSIGQTRLVQLTLAFSTRSLHSAPPSISLLMEL